MQPRGRGRARGGRARGESFQQESNRPGSNSGPPRGPPGPQRGPSGPPGSSRGGGNFQRGGGNFSRGGGNFPRGGGSAPPQGAWGRPLPQGAQGSEQEQRPPQQASRPPQEPWGKKPHQGQSQPAQFQQTQQMGRRNRDGSGEEPSSSKFTHDELKVVSGGGDAGVSHNPTTEKRGGNGGVRGRLNKYEIIHTKPDGIVSKKGKTGVPIRLSANYFKAVNTPNWVLHQYRIDFNPELDDTRLKRKLVQIAYKQENDIGGFLFDGTMMFTPLRLQTENLDRVATTEETGNVCIKIKWVGELNWGDYHYLQVFNILVRKCLHMMELQLVGRNYFDPRAEVTIPNHRLCLWPGYYTSVRQHEKFILMNTELTFKVMRTDNVYDLLLQDQNSFSKKVIGSVVLTYYNNKTYRIDDIDFKKNPRSTFQLKTGEEITYADYFYQKYKINIQVSNQPMLLVRSSKREMNAGMPEEIFLVPELCQLTGLSDDQRSNFQLMSAVAQHTRIAPVGRIAKLRDFVNRLTNNREVLNEVRRWDLNIANSLIEFEGRLLPQESIRLGNERRYSAGAKADWTHHLRNEKLLIPMDMRKLIVISREKEQTEKFMAAVLRVSRTMQININYDIHICQTDKTATLLTNLDEVFKRSPSLVMVIVGSRSADRYNAIKKKCCVDRGIPSQVVQARHTTNVKLAIATKIAIQINCKIGGAPWSVNIPVNGLMVVGYDVCRDTMNKGTSFAGMVASLDGGCTRYFSGVAEQKYGQELSDHFSSFMVMACLKYKEHNGSFPSRICIYRDGVGEGQIVHVRDHEVTNIRERLKEQIYKGEETLFRMAFVVVSKRINTRIFFKDQNPPPGTVVDDTITLPERYDFFIVSQCVNQGTVSPTNYNIVDDNIKLTPDQMQQLAYKMCHMYFNWSGTVRVPAPCQYAHKLAFLTAQSLHRAAHRNLETLLYYL